MKKTKKVKVVDNLMDYAIEVLMREKLVLRRQIDLLRFESDRYQYDFVGKEREERLISLDRALSRLKKKES